jgi:hypothetical protein
VTDLAFYLLCPTFVQTSIKAPNSCSSSGQTGVQQQQAAVQFRKNQTKHASNPLPKETQVQARMKIIANYARVATAHPCRLCFGQWAVILLVTIIVQFAGWLAIDEPVNAEWAITDELTTERSDAYENAISKNGLEFETNEDGDPTNRTTSDLYDSISFMYDAGEDGNVFSPANLRRICDMEQIVFKDERYQDFCKLKADTHECEEQQVSITWFFYGTTQPNCDIELTQAAIDSKIDMLQLGILSASEVGQALKFFVSSDYVPEGYDSTDTSLPDRSTWVNKRTRSLINFGVPIEVDRLPSKGNGDVEAEQLAYMRKYLHTPLQVRS